MVIIKCYQLINHQLIMFQAIKLLKYKMRDVGQVRFLLLNEYVHHPVSFFPPLKEKSGNFLLWKKKDNGKNLLLYKLTSALKVY